MEVCKRCHQEITEDDKYIIGNPHVMSSVIDASLQAGLNRRTPRQSDTQSKYHLECYEILKKEDSKSAIWTILILFILAAIIIGVTLGIVL